MMELAHQRTFARIRRRSAPPQQSPSAQRTARNAMQSVLSDGELFQGFMLWLIGEYAAECLLSVIEFVQFKERMWREHESALTELGPNTLTLPKTLPTSSIVSGDGKDFQSMASELVAKYIAVGAD